MVNGKEECESFYSFLRRNRYVAAGILLFLFLHFGSRMDSLNISMDTEYLINHPGSYHAWFSSGRFGICFSKWILGMDWYNPYFQCMVFVAGFFVFSLILCYLAEKLGAVGKAGLLGTAAIALSHPVLVEQSYFALQQAEMGAAYTYVALAFWAVILWVERSKWYWLLLATVLAVLSFATYQSFAAMYMTGLVGFYFLMGFVEKSGKEYLRKALRFLAAFFVPLVVYLLLQRVLSGSSSYLESMVGWGNLPLRQILKNIMDHFVSLAGGEGIYYSGLQGIFFLMMALGAAAQLFRRYEDWLKRILMCLAGLALVFSPLFLTVALGGEPMKRAQLALPLSLALMLVCVLAAASELFKEKKRSLKAMRALVGFAALTLAWTQTGASQRLFYTDDVRQRQDEVLAAQLSREIDALGLDTPAVVFVGNKKAELNGSCVVGESIGLSFFDIFYGNEPYYYHSTVRILDFMQTQGYVYTMPTEEQVKAARQESVGMPVWPQEGSVRESEGVVIVKLSPDLEYGN